MPAISLFFLIYIFTIETTSFKFIRLCPSILLIYLYLSFFLKSYMHFFPLQKNECVYTLLVNPCKYKLKKIKNIETVLVVVLLLCVMLRYSYSYTRGSVSLTNLPTA